jgi:hypothetical protein
MKQYESEQYRFEQQSHQPLAQSLEPLKMGAIVGPGIPLV